MMELKLQGNDMGDMYALYEALEIEITQAGLADAASVNEPVEPFDEVSYRGDIGPLVTVAVAAVSAGGALTVLISSIASVLAKHMETRKTDLMIEKEGQKVHIQGTAEEIQAILETLKP